MMNIQRLRNLTTGRLHTKMADIYQDIEYITGARGVMPNMRLDATNALLPYLREKAPESRFWTGGYDPSHLGEIDIPPMNSDERAEFWARFGGSSSAESKAVLKLQIAEYAMRDAADAVDAVGSDEAILHAREMRDSAKVLQRWGMEFGERQRDAG